MVESNPQKWFEILEVTAQKRPDEAEDEWKWLMEQLGLGPKYFLAIYEAVRQGRWREAENPVGYLKVAAKREKARETEGGERRTAGGLKGFQRFQCDAEEVTIPGGEVGGEKFTGEEMLDNLEYRQNSGRLVRDQDRTWRTGRGAEVDREGMLRSAGGRSDEEWLRTKIKDLPPGPLAKYAERIKQMRAAAGKDERDEPYIDPAPEGAPDWQKLAQKAGLSEWERKVVEYRMRGMGWRQAVAEQKDEASKRAIRAAWKKMERSGERRLWEAVKKSTTESRRDGEEREENTTAD